VRDGKTGESDSRRAGWNPGDFAGGDRIGFPGVFAGAGEFAGGGCPDNGAYF